MMNLKKWIVHILKLITLLQSPTFTYTFILINYTHNVKIAFVTSILVHVACSDPYVMNRRTPNTFWSRNANEWGDEHMQELG